MEEIYLLWLLSISMLICSFVSGLVPMAFKMSDNKSRLLALMGSGILVGTALTIIIPEGIDSLYGHKNVKFKHADEHAISSDEPAKPADASITHHHSAEARSPFQTTDANMTWKIGASLIVGFVLMLIIDQFSIYQSGGHHHHHHNYHNMNSSSAYEVSKTPRLGGYTLASQDDDIDIGMEEDDKTVIDDPSNEMKPIKNSDSHNVQMRSVPDYAASSGALGSLNNVESQDFSNNVDPNRYYDHSKHISTSLRVKNTKVTPTLGLVIHAAADGIALGAAATTSHRDIEMIIFLAIMLHKAPAAFSLVVLLLHNGLKPATIRRHLLAFSLSAPIAAIVTYHGLSQQGKEALQRNNATGVAMLFSAGTFLFVATVHVLPELIQNKLLTPREMMFLLSGAFLPLLLAQTV